MRARVAPIDAFAPFGVGYALLSAAHGVYAAIKAGSGLGAGDLSATDPRGLATFGLAGIWSGRLLSA
jgi:hypothetical protein